MKNVLDELYNLIGNNEVQKTLEKLQSIFSLAESDLFNDVILLSARFKRLKSDLRKGITSAEEESLRHNKIANATLSLIDEIKENQKQFEKYDLVEEQIQSDTKEKTNKELPAFIKDALLQRISYIKQKNLSIKGLWVDDNPKYQTFEKEILSTIGVEFDVALNSEQAWHQVNHHKYDLIISDICRNENEKAGLEFLSRISKDGLRIPFLFYVADLKPEFGTPPYAFGITNLIADLLHFVMDIIERKN